MAELSDIFNATLLNSLLRFVAPILLAALGGALCERAGVFNIALEGLMLTGAFAAVAVSYALGSALAGTVAAMLAGMLLSLIFGVLAVRFKGDMIVLGIALNLLASGLTVFLLRSLFDVRGAFQDPAIQGLGQVDLPLIEAVPILGPILSGHSWLVYLSLMLVVVLQFILFRHAIGLRLRGAGESPEAARTLGINVEGVKYAAILASGALCGLGGAQLSLGNVTLFVENMSAGRGWIAVAAVMLGQANPVGVLAASLLFGLADSIGFRMQGLGLPSQFTGAIPYLVTLASLFLIAARQRRRIQAPAAGTT